MQAVATAERLPLREAASFFPPEIRPTYWTLHHWVRAGVKGVRLEATWYGGRLYVTREAVERFVAELND